MTDTLKGLNKSGQADLYHMLKLPPGISPSSNDVISALNEYLIDTLQVFLSSICAPKSLVFIF